MTDTREQVERLRYPHHFLHDIENMSVTRRDDRVRELSHWALRHARGNANPKWATAHMYELAHLAASLLSRLEAAEAERDAAVAALKPLADMAAVYDPDDGDGDDVCWSAMGQPQIKHLRAARAALTPAAAQTALDRVKEAARLEERERCARIVDPAPNAKAGLWAENLRKKAAAIREATT